MQIDMARELSDAAYVRMQEAQEAHNELVNDQYMLAERQIHDAFRSFIHCAGAVTVPLAKHDGTLIEQPIKDAIDDILGYPDVDAALMRVLRMSDCPEVANLRKVMAERYTYMHAEDIAEIRAGGEE